MSSSDGTLQAIVPFSLPARWGIRSALTAVSLDANHCRHLEMALFQDQEMMDAHLTHSYIQDSEDERMSISPPATIQSFASATGGMSAGDPIARDPDVEQLLFDERRLMSSHHPAAVHNTGSATGGMSAGNPIARDPGVEQLLFDERTLTSLHHPAAVYNPADATGGMSAGISSRRDAGLPPIADVENYISFSQSDHRLSMTEFMSAEFLKHSTIHNRDQRRETATSW